MASRSNRSRVTPGTGVFPPTYLVAIRLLFSLGTVMWYSEFEAVYQTFSGLEEVADEMIEALGEDAWDPGKARTALSERPANRERYVDFVMPVLMRRLAIQGWYGTDFSNSAHYEDVDLSSMPSFWRQKPIALSSGKHFDIVQRAQYVGEVVHNYTWLHRLDESCSERWNPLRLFSKAQSAGPFRRTRRTTTPTFVHGDQRKMRTGQAWSADGSSADC
ncbi:hypothetical protein AAT19DRAFT_14783 [Rhodotorula toruloides]|uniref:Uncharacterized protein n=1 Tax=Rhodotorula toruloides TaxID=5286 RepID=A0A2T0A8T8_RHOTO|nr:hypothetical protein AAT19DRAFT_14783 [Rhodotorula toruloides]